MSRSSHRIKAEYPTLRILDKLVDFARWGIFSFGLVVIVRRIAGADYNSNLSFVSVGDGGTPPTVRSEVLAAFLGVLVVWVLAWLVRLLVDRLMAFVVASHRATSQE